MNQDKLEINEIRFELEKQTIMPNGMKIDNNNHGIRAICGRKYVEVSFFRSQYKNKLIAEKWLKQLLTNPLLEKIKD